MYFLGWPGTYLDEESVWNVTYFTKSETMAGVRMESEIIKIPRFYGSLQGMLRKFDKYGRQDAFRGATPEEFEAWQQQAR